LGIWESDDQIIKKRYQGSRVQIKSLSKVNEGGISLLRSKEKQLFSGVSGFFPASHIDGHKVIGQSGRASGRVKRVK
jgi:hypothetical protein